MGRRSIYTLRWKFVFVFVLSIVISLAAALAMYQASWLLIDVWPFEPAIVWAVNTIGSMPFLIVAGCLLFLASFFVLSGKIVRYIDEIVRGLQEISKGNLDYRIEHTASDELGQVADQFNDMTRQLRTSIEEERAAEKTKNELITGVSHDLRTPLTSVLGYLELIESDRYKDEVELRHYTGIAYAKAKDLKQLIDRLFEYTSLSGGEIEMKMHFINMNVFLKQLCEEFIPQLSKAGMLHRFSTEDDRLGVSADGNQLMRAFENVISNAIRYGVGGKFVDVRVRRMGGDVAVDIVNYGDPIPERDLPYIFERFYRSDQSRSSETGGTGLGLPIAKSIIERHGGTISACSGPEETVFEIRLPAALPS